MDLHDLDNALLTATILCITLPILAFILFIAYLEISISVEKGIEARAAKRILRLESTQVESNDYRLIAEASRSTSPEIHDSALEKIRGAPLPESIPALIEVLSGRQASPDLKKVIVEIFCSYKSPETTSVLIKHLEYYETVIPELVKNRGPEGIELLLGELENQPLGFLPHFLDKTLLENLSEHRFKKKLSDSQLERYLKVEKDFISKELPRVLSEQKHCPLERDVSYEIAKMISTIEEWRVLENILADFITTQTKVVEYRTWGRGRRVGRNVDSPRDYDENEEPYEPPLEYKTEIVYDCSKLREVIRDLKLLQRLIDQALRSQNSISKN